MKFLRLLAVVAPLFSATLVTAQSSSHGIVTPEALFPQLDAILKQAITQSPGMIARAVDQEIAENERIVARANLLPSVGGYYRFYEARDERANEANNLNVRKEYYDVYLTQPLFHWGERRNNDRIGKIRLAMAQGSYREGYRLLAQEIRLNYLRMISEKLRAKRAAFHNEYMTGQLRQAEDRLAKKVISGAQMFSIEIEAERSRIADERTRFEFDNAKATFARLTGMPVLRDEEIPDSIPPVSPQSEELERLLAGFLAQKDPATNSAFIYRQNLAIEELNLANTKTRLRPKINFVAGTSQDEQSYTVNVENRYAVKSYYAGLSVSWTIFDGLATGATKRAQLARLRQMERDYRSLTEQLARDAQAQVKLAGYMARTAKLNDRLVESGENNVATKREDFRRGVSAEEDVSVAQLSLMDTQYLAYASRVDYYNQVCLFLGTIVEDPVVANLPVTK